MNENEAKSVPEEIQRVDQDREINQNKENFGDSNHNQDPSPIAESCPIGETLSHSESSLDSDYDVITDSSSAPISDNSSSDSVSESAAKESNRISKPQRKRKKEISLEKYRKSKFQKSSSDSESDEEEPFKDGVQKMPNESSPFDNTGSTVIENKESENAVANAAYIMRNPDKSGNEARSQTYFGMPQSEQDLDRLVDAGFFFTGTEDIVRCFYCDIGLKDRNDHDDPFMAHARHSPDCPYLRGKTGQDYIDRVQRDWAMVYTPKRPDLTELQPRLETFQNSSWPSDQVVQTPVQIAEAGFYYVGDGDTVRCHYCGGRLREWEPNDDPWVEHARWFPFCKYLHKVKGIQFVQNAATGNVDNSEPTTILPSESGLEGQAMTSADKHGRESLPKAETLCHKELGLSRNVIRCAANEMAKTKSGMKHNLLMHPAARQLRLKGYTNEEVHLAINKFIEMTGCRQFKTKDLLRIILMMKKDTFLLTDERKKIYEGTKFCGDNDGDVVLSVEALRKENQYLTDTLKCLICCDKDRCIVYVPCGHRIVCESCGRVQQNCSHCGVKVDQRIKTYLYRLLD